MAKNWIWIWVIWHWNPLLCHLCHQRILNYFERVSITGQQTSCCLQPKAKDPGITRVVVVVCAQGPKTYNRFTCLIKCEPVKHEVISYTKIVPFWKYMSIFLHHNCCSRQNLLAFVVDSFTWNSLHITAIALFSF